ncbi:MAG: TlpA family protein disulfide reductase [Lachnospiraceae bacterium]|nr:TlpA family protein disulfide reductase [Lachnospiraceae bacterium]
MKKKTILSAAALVLCMALVLAGCGKKGSEGGSSQAEAGSEQILNGGEEGTTLSFETVDTNGNPVDSETLFAQNKVTMINIWGTTCGPCIGELPELEKMNKEFNQKGGAIVGLVNDVWVNNSKYLGEARDILSDTGVTYTNLCAWEGCNDVLPVVGTPTTYFVDSQGKLIGDPILGADPAKYVEKMEEYLSQAK